MTRGLVILLLLAAVGTGASFCIVVLDEREQGFRTLLSSPDYSLFGIQLNQPVLDKPGWYLRIPGLHHIYRSERRRLHYDSEPRELQTTNKMLLEVDYYALWRIDDPRKFFESVRSVPEATKRLDTVTYGEVRRRIAQNSLADLLSKRRTELASEIASACDEQLKPLGIRVEDVRIRRVDYPESNLKQIFERMRSERNRFARKARAEGEEEARRIRSEADRDSRVLLAEATRKALRDRGEGDAEAARIYAEAYGEDPEFYAFVRSLEAYRNSLDDETTLILSPQSPFLRYLFDGVAPPTR